jgi:hypothetical protein
VLVAAADGGASADELRKAADEGRLTKYFDVNLTQVIVEEPPVRDTVEIRILPGGIDAGPILDRAGLVELLLDRCERPSPFPDPPADPAAAVEALLEVAAAALADRDE